MCGDIKLFLRGIKMNRIAIVTDSNSGITPAEASELEGVFVLPMPVIIGNDTFYEGIDMSHERFYEVLGVRSDLSTSQPSVSAVTELWDKVLEEYDSIVHIPMSSGLSGACQTARMISEDYDGKVEVVNNQRISVTQRRSVYDALLLRDSGRNAQEIREFLEEVKMQSSIYIMVDTLFYLKKGGRVTPAAAAIGTALKLKPVLQIHGEKLDAYALARTVGIAKNKMISAIKTDMNEEFGGESPDNMHIDIAYTYNYNAALEFREELKTVFPDFNDIIINPLSLSVSTHIGPGSLAIACSRKIKV